MDAVEVHVPPSSAGSSAMLSAVVSLARRVHCTLGDAEGRTSNGGVVRNGVENELDTFGTETAKTNTKRDAKRAIMMLFCLSTAVLIFHSDFTLA